MPGDYCTTADIREYLEIQGTQHDATLAKLSTRVSRWIDNFCQVPKGFDREIVSAENLRGIIDKEGNLVFAVGKATAQSITALSWGITPLNLTPLDPQWCWATWGEQGGHVVKWMGGSLGHYRGRSIIVQASYDGGYTTVPDELTHACIIVAARAWKSRNAGFADVVGSAETGTFMYAKLAPAHVVASLTNHIRRAPW